MSDFLKEKKSVTCNASGLKRGGKRTLNMLTVFGARCGICNNFTNDS